MTNTLSKQVVFLSHSSADGEALNKLRNLLLDKTGRSIDFFLSSDGQSIRLGKNWVHVIEEALATCKIMFVFVTPASLRSRWINFEAGFAYANKISVIPVGCFGIDLESIPPPLNLLQGFNISDAAGLNNIIAVLNGEFDFSHAESFTEHEFRAIFENVSGPISQGHSGIADLVGDVELNIPSDTDLLESLENYLIDKGIEFVTGDGVIAAFGLEARRDREARSNGSFGYLLKFQLGYEMLAANLPLILGFAERLEAAPDAPIKITIQFAKPIKPCGDNHKISARLFGTEVRLRSASQMEFRGIAFELDTSYTLFGGVENIRRVEGPTTLKLIGSPEALTFRNIDDLLATLREREVIADDAFVGVESLA